MTATLSMLQKKLWVTFHSIVANNGVYTMFDVVSMVTKYKNILNKYKTPLYPYTSCKLLIFKFDIALKYFSTLFLFLRLFFNYTDMSLMKRVNSKLRYTTHNILFINVITFLETDNMYKCEKMYSIIRMKMFSYP